MAEGSEDTAKTEGKRKCQYQYKSMEFKGTRCPHEALFKKDICYWHEERDEKDVVKDIGEDLEKLDLNEAYLAEANLKAVNLERAELLIANLEGANLFTANLVFANLQMANLHDANLGSTDLGAAVLKGADLGNANLQQAFMFLATLRGSNLRGANLKQANLYGADLSDCDFSTITTLEKVNLVRCKLENSSLKNALDNLDKICVNELDYDYLEAKEVYVNLKNYFDREGLYDESRYFHYREKLMDKKLHKQHKRWIKWIGNNIYHYLAGYGEHPLWVLIWWAIIILFFGTLYWGLNGLILHGEAVTNPLDYYYFSVVTFTTLGFGDIQPNPNMNHVKIFVMSEALLGAFMMALFVLTFGRKMIR